MTDEERRELLTRQYTEVQDEYIRNSTPGKGKLTHDEGCTEKLYKDELRFAEWFYQKLGGNIHVLEEHNDTEKQKNPDYLWNDKLWDLKTPKNEKGANSLIRKGLQQIAENPGGVILDYKDKNISLVDLQKVIDKRMQWVHDKTIDIMIVNKGEIVKVLRYKK